MARHKNPDSLAAQVKPSHRCGCTVTVPKGTMMYVPMYTSGTTTSVSEWSTIDTLEIGATHTPGWAWREGGNSHDLMMRAFSQVRTELPARGMVVGSHGAYVTIMCDEGVGTALPMWVERNFESDGNRWVPTYGRRHRFGPQSDRLIVVKAADVTFVFTYRREVDTCLGTKQVPLFAA